MSQIITTNLRIDKDDWTQMKVLAAELHMSANQYVTYLLKNLSTRRVLEANLGKKHALPIWELGALKLEKNPQGLSEEDKNIYE